MLFFYRILINLVIILSPLIIIARLIKKKENLFRFKEKFCINTKKRYRGKLIWFHGASVGELKSILPLIEKFEKNKKINQILITSNTLSSSIIVKKFKSKKIVHQFFPIDTNFFSNSFLNYWKPELAFFIDSEIWPNMIFNLSKKNIPIILLNGRITKKTFKRWKLFPKFSRSLFSKFKFCFSSDLNSKIFLKNLGAKNVKLIGNLKFSEVENLNDNIDKNLIEFLRTKKVWCASSTHHGEEKVCAQVHKELKKKYENLLTIIIPRHVERVDTIKKELIEMRLKTHIHMPKKKIDIDTDIYIVNIYGSTKSFYNSCNNVFLGGSIINHGGQNPLEAARYGCSVLHGPNIKNFKEIYLFLKKNSIAIKIYNKRNMVTALSKNFSKSLNSSKIKKKINLIGERILTKTYNEILKILKNEL